MMMTTMFSFYYLYVPEYRNVLVSAGAFRRRKKASDQDVELRNLGAILQERWTGKAGPLQDYYVFLLAGPFLQILIKIS